MSREDKRATQRGDEVDEISTSDLEAEADYGFEHHSEYFERHKINLARAMLGYDGGYSVRRLKRFFKDERQW
jgi:hypothetical protein